MQKYLELAIDAAYEYLVKTKLTGEEIEHMKYVGDKDIINLEEEVRWYIFDETKITGGARLEMFEDAITSLDKVERLMYNIEQHTGNSMYVSSVEECWELFEMDTKFQTICEDMFMYDLVFDEGLDLYAFDDIFSAAMARLPYRD